MRGSAMAACLAVTMATAAHAEWKVSTYVDQMTDRTEIAATLPATVGQANLRVACLKGRAFPEINFPSHVGFLRIDASYRFDDAPVVSRTAPLSRDGRSLWLWSGGQAAALKRIADAKRLRVQIFPVAAPVEFLDFNLTGADKAIKQVKCK